MLLIIVSFHIWHILGTSMKIKYIKDSNTTKSDLKKDDEQIQSNATVS